MFLLLVLPQWDVLVFLCFFTALQCETNWTVTYTSSNVCALRGSTVKISVSYEYTHHKPQSSSIVKELLWLTKIDRNHPGDTASDTYYKGRVEYNCGKNDCTASTCSGECTLTIKELKLSDSAEYKLWIMTAQTDWEYTIPGVNLTVRGKLDNNILLMWMKLELVIIIIHLLPCNQRLML